MGRAESARRERPSRRLSFRSRRPAGTAAPSSASFARCLPRAAARLFLVLAGLLAVPTAVQAQEITTLVTNGPTSGAASATAFRAQSFRTGPNAAGYTLSAIGLWLTSSSGNSMTVAVRKDDNGTPDETADGLVATLTSPATLTKPGLNTFTAPNGTFLERSTRYWVSVHEGIASSSERASYQSTQRDQQSGETGWSIGNNSLWRENESSSWSDSIQSVVLRIEGTVVSNNVDLEALELEADDSRVEVTPPGLRSSFNEALVDEETDIVTILATPLVEGATVKYRRADDTVIEDDDTNKEGHQVALWSRENVIRMKVTSAGGGVSRHYRLTIWRLGSLTQQPATGRPVISGTPRVGQTLTVSIGNVDDPNGTHFAETGAVVNYIKNGFRFSSRWVNEDGEDPNVVRNSSSGTSRVLEKIDVGRRIVAKVCFRDDLGNQECRLSQPTARVAGEELVIRNTSRVITGSLCDYVYPAGPDCATETSAREIGGRIEVLTTTNVNVTHRATLALTSDTTTKITRDEFGNLHEVDYRFELGDDGILRTVVGEAYPFLEAPLCPRDENPPHACQGGRSSIANWQIDSVDVEVRATLDGGSLVDRYATARIPVMITSHDTARRIRSGSDRRCANARCYGRKLTPGQTLYKDNATEPTTRSIGQPPPPSKPPKGNVGKGIGEEPQETALTASFENLPREHDGETPFEFNLVFDQEVYEGTEAVNKNKAVRQALTVTGGRVTGGRRLVKEKFDVYVIKVTPDGHETVTIKLEPPSDACTPATPTCTPDGVRLGKAVTDTVKGPPTLSVANASVEEELDASLEFVVTLGRAATGTVTVDYETVDGTAEAGDDYTQTSGRLSFLPGDVEKTIVVPVLDDSIDEGEETMTLELSNASGAHIIDHEATGTIENSDLMPQAWLGRFGRTVAEQVLDAVEARMQAPRSSGSEVTVAGRRLGGGAPGSEALAEAEAEREARRVSDWLRGEACDDGSGAGAECPAGTSGRSRALTGHELLTGSAFALTGGSAEGGYATLWGRGAVSRFDGREGELSLDGEVASVMLGTDWALERWTAGLVLSHARGDGGYQASSRSERNRGVSGGEVSSTVTGLYPWGRYALSDRVTVWGAAGYGAGTLTLTPENGGVLETDMDLAMAAAGLRGVVIEARPEGGPELAAKTDALGVRTSSEAVRGGGDGGGNLAAAQGDVTRLRLGLEGTWKGLAIGTGTLTPRLEAGVRHDGGDAETGFGLDLGGGLAWSDPGTGLRAEASGRGLLTHEAGGLGQRGFAGSFGWDPRPGSERGPSVTLTQTMGLAASGGADALLGRATLAGLTANDDGAELGRRRLEVKLGYGVEVFGDRFTAVPEAGLALSAGRREYSVGWRLARERRGGDIGSLGLSVEARRRESTAADTAPEDRVGMRLDMHW